VVLSGPSLTERCECEGVLADDPRSSKKISTVISQGLTPDFQQVIN